MDGALPSIMIDPEFAEEIKPIALDSKVKCFWNGRHYYGQLKKVVNGFAIINTRDAKCTVNVPLDLVTADS